MRNLMPEKLTIKEILAIVAIVVSMLGSLVYGYFMLKENQVQKQTENCWDKYTTEHEAIMNCENHDN